MIDKYFYLMLLIAINTTGIDSNVLKVSYSYDKVELIDGEVKELGQANVSLTLTQEERNYWLIKDNITNRNAILEITDSEIILKDKSDIRIKSDWIDFKGFQLKDRDTLFHTEKKTEQFEIFRDRKQKIMQIRVIDKETTHQINQLKISY